jgi:hypothetical protein
MDSMSKGNDEDIRFSINEVWEGKVTMGMTEVLLDHDMAESMSSGHRSCCTVPDPGAVTT